MPVRDCSVLIETQQIRCWDILRSRRYRRLALRLFFGSSLLLFFIALGGLIVFDYQHNHLLLDYARTKEDIAILSTTYYERSKSFPNNTAVVLFTAHQLFYLKYPSLAFMSSNSTHTMKANFRIEQVVAQVPFYCKWVPFLAIGQVQPDMTSLRLVTGSSATEISYRQPHISPHHPVVACFTPLFMNERWQLLLLSTEVYSHYGAFLQFYIRSMLTDLHRLLEKYQNVRVAPWPAVDLGKNKAMPDSFNVNSEMEFRNQAAAMTDCLLMYKETADYVIFPDLDDVIIPRLGADYLEEFQKVFGRYPMAAAVAYNMSQTTLESGTSPDVFSISNTLHSVRFRGEVRWGKLVVRPELVNSVWIHRSYGIRESYEQISLPVELNSLLHLRFWNLTENPRVSSVAAAYDPYLARASGNSIVSENDLSLIEEKFDRRKKEFGVLYEELRTEEKYYNLLEKCYNDMFYNGESHSTCKGPELCKIPKMPGIRCMNVQAEIDTFEGEHGLFVHKLVSTQLEESNDGCIV